MKLSVHGSIDISSQVAGCGLDDNKVRRYTSMNKILMGVFDSEIEAYEGLDALKDLHGKGDITVYATSVLTKDFDGVVTIKQVAEEGAIGTAVGMLGGGMVGLVAGPVGAVAGATAGSLAGLLIDVENSGVNADFLNEFSEVLIPGKTALLAEIDEDWVAPVNAEFERIGGVVFRVPRHEIVEDQLISYSAALSAEMKALQEEMKESGEKGKVSFQKTSDSVKKHLKSIVEKIDTKLDHINKEAEAKKIALTNQLKAAKKEQAENIEKRIEDIKARQKRRTDKLKQASVLVKEALTL